MALLEIRDLKKHFPVPSGALGKAHEYVKAIDGVSFDVDDGETVGLVGESGCGKTSLGRCLVRLSEPTGGTVTFEGQELSSLSGSAMREKRRKMQMIFQDPYASLNPRMRVGEIVAEGLTIHGLATGNALKLRVRELLTRVGLREEYYGRYPHEFSGGQRQRIAIARALITQPKLIVADEPVSALDVSVQAQVLNLMQDLQEQFGLSYILISHDLAVVDYLCDEVAVMYLGRIVEQGRPEDLFERCAHPYTRALLDAVPRARASGGRRRRGAQAIASQSAAAAGCPYVARCALADQHCREVLPLLRKIGEAHFAACHKAEAVMALPHAALEG